MLLKQGCCGLLFAEFPELLSAVKPIVCVLPGVPPFGIWGCLCRKPGCLIFVEDGNLAILTGQLELHLQPQRILRLLVLRGEQIETLSDATYSAIFTDKKYSSNESYS